MDCKPTQRDRDAAATFFRDERTALSVKFSLGHDPAPLLETLARHAAAERAIGYRIGIEAAAELITPGHVEQSHPAKCSCVYCESWRDVRAIRDLSDNAEAIARGE
jgi:predicted pyridoxine 5'-phosphate oxidase superfamily flavin-nucleotide-binding protein